MNIVIGVANRVSTPPSNAVIVCGNSDYTLTFEFDAEWSAETVKIARFVWFSRNKTYSEEVTFEGNTVEVPILSNTNAVHVGVYAGNLRTTTPAKIVCEPSILCYGQDANMNPNDIALIKGQIADLVKALKDISVDPAEIRNTVMEYLAKNPPKETDPTVHEWAKQPQKPKYTAKEIGAVASSELSTAVNDALAQAKASGEFDGRDGNDGDDYVLTPADMAEIAEMAAKLVDVPEQDSGGNADLTGYATEEWVQEGYQPKGDYLTEVPAGYATEEFVKNKIAEAELGGEEVDLSGYAQKSELPTKVSQLQNDSGYLTVVPDEYAKTADIPTKPSDIGAQPEGDYALRSEIPSVPVKSVNGKTGAVSLTASDVGARPSTWMPSASEVGALPASTVIPTVPTKVSAFENDKGYLTEHQDLSDYAKTGDIPVKPEDIGAQPAGNYALKTEIPSVPVQSVNGKTGAVSLSASDVKARPDTWMPTAQEVGALPSSTSIPSKTSQLTNDSGFITGYTETDPTVPSWAKQANKPSYTASEVGALPNTTKIPSKTSDLANDSGYITGYTETDPTVPAWAKQSTKPSYSKSEVGLGNVDNVKQYSASNPPPYPVTSVNGKTGAVMLDIPGSYTIPSFWQSAVDTAIATIKSLQKGKNCITFPFFSDNHQRNGYAGVLIRKVMDECHIPFCFYGGDSISNGTIADEATMIEQDKAFDTMMSVVPNGRVCRAVGNHDGYWYDGTNKFYYDRDQIYELFLREESVAQNKHFGGDGTYYYVDEIASRVRFIVLNTNGGSVDDAQIAWFRDVALKVDAGWAVVIISHQPISNHYHANISNAAAVRSIVTESGVEIIGWFSGHIHRDRIYTGAAVNATDDSEGADMGFKQVTITSDHTGIAYDDATKHTVASDNKSHAIDFVTINRDTKTVNLTRLGIGNNRVYSYENAVLYSVTNNLNNVVTNNTVSSVEEGNAYTATLTASNGYELKSVTVTMGGVNITSTAYSNGVITIAEVTGNVVITASAEKAVEPVANIWQTPYKLNSRLNTSESDPQKDGMFISAWYPVSQEQLSGDIILRSNKDVFNYTKISTSGDYLRFYSSATANSRIMNVDMSVVAEATRAYDSKTGIYSVTITRDRFSANASEIKYFRWSAAVSTSAITADWFDGCILTINQEIT